MACDGKPHADTSYPARLYLASNAPCFCAPPSMKRERNTRILGRLCISLSCALLRRFNVPSRAPVLSGGLSAHNSRGWQQSSATIVARFGKRFQTRIAAPGGSKESSVVEPPIRPLRTRKGSCRGFSSLRRIRPLIDERTIRRACRDLYSPIGRPSIPPEQLFLALVGGYLLGVTSERKFVIELQCNMAVRWFVGLNLDEQPWDASTFSQNRRRRFDEAGMLSGCSMRRSSGRWPKAW